MEFVDWLNAELEARGWSNSELARRAGVVPSTVSMVISGHSKPGVDFCLGVARALNEPPEKVFRLAGLLPSKPSGDPGLEELSFYYHHLPTDLRRQLRLTAKALVRELRDEYRTDEDEDLAPGPSPA